MASNIMFSCCFLLYLLAVPLTAVTVNPLCPTNKIAPHKRFASWDYVRGRTFGAFYDLLAPNSNNNNYNQPYDTPDDLQETPQEDDPDDCGDIEDYDENDLSSITPGGQRRRIANGDKTFGFFIPPNHQSGPSTNRPQRPPYPTRPPYSDRPTYPGDRPPYPGNRPPYTDNRPPYSENRPPYPGNRPPNRPPNPNRPPYPSTRPPTARPPYPATRPPYWSGGLFGTNEYRPPLHQNPSDYIKPIHEYSDNSQVTYRPNLVGAPLGHVVGASPARPTTDDFQPTTARIYPNRMPHSSHSHTIPSRPSRPRNLNNNSILGSFVDLLFK